MLYSTQTDDDGGGGTTTTIIATTPVPLYINVHVPVPMWFSAFFFCLFYISEYIGKIIQEYRGIHN